MGETTGIEWTGKTWNPWHGCIKVSPGCKFCYMYREKRKYGQDPMQVKRSKTTFYDPLKWTEPDFVFTCSWSDFFIEQADGAWREDAWSVIRRTPHLIYQILTKRTDRVLDCLPNDWGTGYPNVWLGFSAESQRELVQRYADMAYVPNRLLWVSLEPQLGPIELIMKDARAEVNYLRGFARSKEGVKVAPPIQWVVNGFESGHKEEDVRPGHPDWARRNRDDCVAEGVPFFFKQWGEYREFDDGQAGNKLEVQIVPHEASLPVGEQYRFVSYDGHVISHQEEMRPDVEYRMMERVGKTKAGHVLDGKVWQQFPAAANDVIEAKACRAVQKNLAARRN